MKVSHWIWKESIFPDPSMPTNLGSRPFLNVTTDCGKSGLLWLPRALFQQGWHPRNLGRCQRMCFWTWSLSSKNCLKRRVTPANNLNFSMQNIWSVEKLLQTACYLVCVSMLAVSWAAFEQLTSCKDFTEKQFGPTLTIQFPVIFGTSILPCLQGMALSAMVLASECEWRAIDFRMAKDHFTNACANFDCQNQRDFLGNFEAGVGLNGVSLGFHGVCVGFLLFLFSVPWA